MAIVKELKNLGKKMTGVDISGNIISETLKAIEKNCAGGSAAETIVLDETLGEGAKLSDSLYEYKVPLDAIPDVPHEGVYLSVNGTQYPLAYHEDEEYAYSAVYNMDPQSAEPTGDPWFIVAIKEEVGTGNDVLPGLLGGTENTAYILYVTTGEPIDNATIKLISKAAAPSGGNDDFIIHATLIPGDNAFEISDADAGFADIVSAVNAGKTVKLCADVNPALEYSIHAELVLSVIMGEGGVDSFATFYGAANNGEAGDSRILVVIAEPASVGDGLDFTTHMYVPAPYEFHFTATPTQSEDAWIATPDDSEHDKYSNIRDALSQTPLVFAVISIPAKHQVARTLFSVDYTQTGSEFLSALAMFWSGTKFMGARLAVPASGDPSIVFSET